MEKSKYIGSVSIGHQLKKYRELAGMTQYQMAAKLHLGETTYGKTYGNYERGVREPDIDTLKRICDYFHVSMDVMVGRQIKNPQTSVDDVSSMQEDIKYIAKMVCQIRNKLGREDGRGAR